jgi:hypothetical protein
MKDLDIAVLDASSQYGAISIRATAAETDRIAKLLWVRSWSAVPLDKPDAVEYDSAGAAGPHVEADHPAQDDL